MLEGGGRGTFFFAALWLTGTAHVTFRQLYTKRSQTAPEHHPSITMNARKLCAMPTRAKPPPHPFRTTVLELRMRSHQTDLVLPPHLSPNFPEGMRTEREVIIKHTRSPRAVARTASPRSSRTYFARRIKARRIKARRIASLSPATPRGPAAPAALQPQRPRCRPWRRSCRARGTATSAQSPSTRRCLWASCPRPGMCAVPGDASTAPPTPSCLRPGHCARTHVVPLPSHLPHSPSQPPSYTRTPRVRAGLDAAGKTTILYGIAIGEDIHTTIPTIGAWCEVMRAWGVCAVGLVLALVLALAVCCGGGGDGGACVFGGGGRGDPPHFLHRPLPSLAACLPPLVAITQAVGSGERGGGVERAGGVLWSICLCVLGEGGEGGVKNGAGEQSAIQRSARARPTPPARYARPRFQVLY